MKILRILQRFLKWYFTESLKPRTKEQEIHRQSYQ